MHELTGHERGFLEGAIDFEGHLRIFGVFRAKQNKKYFQAIGRVFNTNLEVLMRINTMLNEECKTKLETRKIGPHWKPAMF